MRAIWKGQVIAESVVPVRAADGTAELDRLASRDQKVVFHFQETPITRILDALAGAGSFKVTFDGPVEDSRVSLDSKDATIKEALLQLAEEGHLRYSVPGSDELVVRGTAGKPP